MAQESKLSQEWIPPLTNLVGFLEELIHGNLYDRVP